MMSLNKVSATQNIFQQVKWKFSTMSTTFYSVILIQLIFMLLTFSGTGMSSSGFGGVSVEERFHSLDLLLIVSALTMILLGWMLATKGVTNYNFSVVTTRFTAHASTILFAICLCVVSTLTAFSSFYIVVFLRGLLIDIEMIMPSSMVSAESFVLFMLILVLACAAGYFMGSLIYVSKLFILLLMFIAFYWTRSYIDNTSAIFNFYFETSLMDFVWKAVVTAAVLFVGAIVVKNSKEVSRV